MDLRAAIGERDTSELARIRMVVDGENSDALERARRPLGARHAGGERSVRRGAQGERHREHRAPPRPLAVRGDGASVKRDDMADDGEPEPETTRAATALSLTEAIEDVRQQRRLDAGAGVTHRDDDLAALSYEPELDRDAAAGRRELD